MIDILTEEQQKLVEDNYNLIYSFLKKYNLDVEEFYDLAAIGLCTAAESYNEGVSSFSTYAYICMSSRVFTYMKGERTSITIPKDKIFSYNAEIPIESDKVREYIDVLPDPHDYESESIERISLEQAIKKLKPKQIDIDILNYLIAGYKQTEIADLIGCSRQNVSARIYRFKEKLNKELNRKE